MKHIDGPWQYTFEGGTVAFIVEADGTVIAKLSTLENSTGHKSLPANCMLMAASPTLLAELKFAVSLLRPMFGGTIQVERMEAAIKRAEGDWQ